MNKTTSKRLLALDILRGITIGTRPMERFDTDRSRIPLFHVYHGNIYLYFSPEIQF